jgi:thiol-disulfide isomerase/thioredoxin
LCCSTAAPWCPYCNAQLRAFERSGQALAEAGVKVAALSVDESRVDAVGSFAVSADGNLTELPGSPAPLAAGATPAGIAVS